MLPLPLALLLAAAPTPEAAIAAALRGSGARAEVLEVRTTSGGCDAESFEAQGRIEASGRVPLRYAGRDRAGRQCAGAAWAHVRVLAPALVVARDVRAGEPLEAAVATAEREVRPGRAPLLSVPPSALAARALHAGELLAPSAVQVGPRPGEAVTVVVRAGPLELERSARAIPCARERACALLPGGRRVEGRWVEGRILLEAP
jgi:hypothetical protein